MARTGFAIALSFSVLLLVRPAAAQVCGDADGSGTVTVTDGVQTLRAAAGLDSACTLAACDIDGSGSITVTDGVGVLRIAAGLDVAQNCSGGSTGPQPQTVLQELQPLFKFGLPLATGQTVTACANAPDGTVDVTTDTDGTTTSFDTCQVDSVDLTGDVLVSTTMAIDLTVETTDGDDVADYLGSDDLTIGTAGASTTLAGMLDLSDTNSAGDLTITLSGVAVTAGQITGGTATVDLTDSDIVDSFTQLAITFEGGGAATVVATESNGATVRFHYDLATGSATPS